MPKAKSQKSLEEFQKPIDQMSGGEIEEWQASMFEDGIHPQQVQYPRSGATVTRYDKALEAVIETASSGEEFVLSLRDGRVQRTPLEKPEIKLPALASRSALRVARLALILALGTDLFRLATALFEHLPFRLMDDWVSLIPTMITIILLATALVGLATDEKDSRRRGSSMHEKR